eukprot:SAG31_NODE_2671_length_5270_cov_5.903114_1_plen_481_part_00
MLLLLLLLSLSLYGSLIASAGAAVGTSVAGHRMQSAGSASFPIGTFTVVGLDSSDWDGYLATAGFNRGMPLPDGISFNSSTFDLMQRFRDAAAQRGMGVFLSLKDFCHCSHLGPKSQSVETRQLAAWALVRCDTRSPGAKLRVTPATKLDDEGAWQRNHQNLLTGLNIYNPHVLRVPTENFYRMYFFGWASAVCNVDKHLGGCDAIFAARSIPGKKLAAWEVFSGDGLAWDRTDNSSLWIPVLTAGSPEYRPWDSVHNGDPSVVYHNDRFVMAFSTTGPGNCSPGRPCTASAPGRANVWGIGMAQSKDGIHFVKSRQPALLHAPLAQNLHFPALAPPFNGSYPYFARPSLMWEEDSRRWRLWCDYLYPPGGMAHAECRGDPLDANCWHLTHNLSTPLIVGWPNAAVIKVAQSQFLAYGDPAGYNSTQKPLVWTTRQIRQAYSSDGLNWAVGDFLPPGRLQCFLCQSMIFQLETYIRYCLL